MNISRLVISIIMLSFIYFGIYLEIMDTLICRGDINCKWMLQEIDEYYLYIYIISPILMRIIDKDMDVCII